MLMMVVSPMAKKAPQRTCMACQIKADKKDLLRIVRDANGDVRLDQTGKMPGRGAYICSNSDCLERVIKTKRLQNVLETPVADHVYDDLRNHIAGHNNG